MDDDAKGKRWEQGIERGWDEVKVDNEGFIDVEDLEAKERKRRRTLRDDLGSIRRNMIRQMIIVIDGSSCMNSVDMRPTRIRCVVSGVKLLVESYFNQNPISQLQILTTKNNRVQTVSNLDGNCSLQLDKLTVAGEELCKKPEGEPSLQNVLKLALRTLSDSPKHASRELLIIYGSLTSCDPGNIHDTIEHLKKANIKCSVLHLAASVHVCEKLCRETGGSHKVALHELDFRNTLLKFATPPPAAMSTVPSLIAMGFPKLEIDTARTPLTGYSLSDTKMEKIFQSSGYFCPQCKAKHPAVPADCRVCGLQLVSAPHLARSYHHLFPVAPFTEVAIANVTGKICDGCESNFAGEDKAYQCKKCEGLYCFDCDSCIHESVHNCPKCLTTKPTTTPPIPS
eukprot:m.153070 g.153070  ORF g.153070 m.153070 type:complete len:397 (-) comp30827_c0_seq1:277-1467(-)